MSGLPSTGRSGWRDAFSRGFPPILDQEKARWIFVLRALLAAFLATGFSMAVNLDKPYTAMLTALIVIQPRSGDVLAKSLYRLLGTLAGGLMALLLFSLCAGQSVLILCGLAAWVGLCTAGSARQRDNQSYGFVLAGYTAAIIALPCLVAPEDIFNTTMLRMAEVFVGMVSAALCSELVFPGKVSSVLYTAARGRFTLFDTFVKGALSGSIRQSEVQDIHLKFIRDVALLDSYGAAVSFEAGGTMRRESVRLFNAGFMAVSTSFYTLYAFLRTLSPSPADRTRALFDRVSLAIAEDMTAGGKTAEAARDTAKAFAQRQAALNRVFTDYEQSRALSPEDKVTVNIGRHLVNRFLDDMHDYLTHYAALTGGEGAPGSAGRTPFGPSSDMSIALVSGLRAGIILLLVTWAWWAASWPSATGSNMTIAATVFCSLLAASPDPLRSIFLTTVGCLLGAGATIVFVFFILPHLSSYWTLCAAMLPFLSIGLYLKTIPAYSSQGAMYCSMFAMFAGPTLVLDIDPPYLMGGILSQVFGVLLAGAVFATILPTGGAWWRRRLKAGLLREGRAACLGNPSNLLYRFESGLRDLLLQFTSSPFVDETAKQEYLRQAMAISELGRIVIEIRQAGRQAGLTEKEENELERLVTEAGELLSAPTGPACEALFAELEEHMRRVGIRPYKTSSPGGAAVKPVTESAQAAPEQPEHFLRFGEQLRILHHAVGRTAQAFAFAPPAREESDHA